MAEQVVYKVEGLDCAEEVAVLKKEVGNKADVSDLDFDILKARMTVTYDQDEITWPALFLNFELLMPLEEKADKCQRSRLSPFHRKPFYNKFDSVDVSGWRSGIAIFNWH